MTAIAILSEQTASTPFSDLLFSIDHPFVLRTPADRSPEAVHQHRRLCAAWKMHVKTQKPTAAQHLLFNLLRGKPPQHGFTPITNPVKLQNGQHAFQGLRCASNNLSWSFAKAAQPFFRIDDQKVRSDVFWSGLLGSGGPKAVADFMAAAYRVEALT